MDKRKFIPIFKNFKNNLIVERRSPGADLAIWRTAEFLDKEYNLDILSLIGKNDPEYTEKLRSKIPENFCLYPFTHFQLDPDGRARPCCKYKVGNDGWQTDVPKLPDVDIGELWEQQEFQDLRDQFLRNERPEGCKACWDEEAAGMTSMRLIREQGGKEHPFATVFRHIPRLYPKTLDLKLSNLCNLKCRICTPFLSSQWIKEIKDLNIQDMGQVDTFTQNSREKFSANPNNEEILKQWAPGIEYLEFYGGEPLMQQEHDKILDVIYSYGNPQNTGLYYNTNSTICKESFFEKWKLFNSVTINFSIDDIGQRFEYQRKNAKWLESLENIRLFREYSKKHNVNMDLRIYTTVGVLNVFYLKEFFDEIKKLDLKIVLNMVHYPHHYAITILPTEVKDIVRDKLVSIDTENILHRESPSLQNVINFMYGTDSNLKLLDKFFEKTEMHDAFRNESFKETFPELYELLNKHKGSV